MNNPDFKNKISLLRVKEAMLSLVSVTVMLTVVVDVLPEAIPLMSWALTTTTYWLLVSRSRVLVLQLITPAERQWERRTDGEGVIFEVSSDSYSSKNSFIDLLKKKKTVLLQDKDHVGDQSSEPTCDTVDLEGRKVSVLVQRVPELSVSGAGIIGIGCPHLHYFSS